MTDQERAVMQQALEALEQDNPAGRTATITALRAALAQEQATGSWRDGVLEGQLRERERWLAQQPEPVQKPVAVVRSVVGQGDEGVRIKWLGGFPQIGDPLYTAPPQRPPLTDGEIEDIWNRYCDELGEASINDAIDIARAIERKVRGETE